MDPKIQNAIGEQVLEKAMCMEIPPNDTFHRVWDTDGSSDDEDASPWQVSNARNSKIASPRTELHERGSKGAGVIGMDVAVAYSIKGSKLKRSAQTDSQTIQRLSRVSSTYTGATDFFSKSDFKLCSICRCDLLGKRLFCLRCPNHVLCGNCHDRFAAHLWVDSEHEFVWIEPKTIGSASVPAPPLPPPPIEIDFNALLASEPSLGSIHHRLGHCHPCHYAHSRVGCRNGKACGLCHYTHDRRKRGFKTKPMWQAQVNAPRHSHQAEKIRHCKIEDRSENDQ